MCAACFDITELRILLTQRIVFVEYDYQNIQ
jgi:hypothetical protein